MIKQFIASIKSAPGKWIFLLTAATALLLRLEYLREYSNLVHFPFALGPDITEYDERARELLNGILFPAEPEIHAPLYSFFLASLYQIANCSIAAVRAVQLFLNWGAFIAIALLVRKISNSWKLAVIFLALALFTPVIFFYQAELVSESLLAPLTAVLLWLLYYAKKNPRCVFGAGIVLGFMVLTHGLMNFILIAEAGYYALKKEWKNALLILAGAVIVIGGVVTAKSIHYRKLTPVQSNSAFNLWIGHNSDATGGCYLPPGEWAKERKKLVAEAKENNISFERHIVGNILHFYKKSPKHILMLPLKKLAMLLSSQEEVSGADPMYMIMLTQVQKYGAGMMAAVILLALCGIYFAWKKKEKRYIHFYIIGGALSVGLLLTVVSGRYRQGIMPAALFLAAIGVLYLGKKALAIIVPCIISGMLILPPLSGGIQRNGRAASILGEAHFRLKEFEKAQELLLIAERSDDHPERFDNMLGAIAEETGNILIALARYKQAMEKAPSHPDGFLNAGHLYFFNFPDEREQALVLIKEALARKADLPSAYDMLGQDLAQKKDFDGALKMFDLALFYAPENELYKKKVELCRNLAKERGKNAPESRDR